MLFFIQILSFDFRHFENDVLVDLLVHGELSSLTERTVAAWMVAFKRLLLSVDIHVLLEILCQGELFKAEHADMMLSLLV